MFGFAEFVFPLADPLKLESSLKFKLEILVQRDFPLGKQAFHAHFVKRRKHVGR